MAAKVCQHRVNVNPLTLSQRPLSLKRLLHRTTRQDGLAVFRHRLHVQLVHNYELGEPEMSTVRGRGAEEWISTLDVELRIRIRIRKGALKVSFSALRRPPALILGSLSSQRYGRLT